VAVITVRSVPNSRLSFGCIPSSKDCIRVLKAKYIGS
jgi:hypothetical protein